MWSLWCSKLPWQRESPAKRPFFFIFLTNRKWFSVVCTLIDNDIRHHSGQNVAPRESTTNFDQYIKYQISLSIRVQTTLNHFWFVFTTIFDAKEVFISEFDQNHDTNKEQALSTTFSQYDWFIFQNEHSWLAIALRHKLMRAWCEHHCLDSYRQWQISQSDCEITSNCGKKLHIHEQDEDSVEWIQSHLNSVIFLRWLWFCSTEF